MGAKNTQTKRITFLSLKSKTSDTDPTPYFGKQEKKGDSWQITEKFNSVDGYLKSIKHSSYEYEGETKYKCTIEFQDESGEVTVVGCNFNNLLYSILNSLAGIDFLGLVDIRVYSKNAKDGGKVFASAYVQNDGKKTDWKYSYETVPKSEKVKVGNKTVTDDTKVVAFWQKEIDGINSRLGIKVLEQKEFTQEQSEKVKQIDDLPF